MRFSVFKKLASELKSSVFILNSPLLSEAKPTLTILRVSFVLPAFASAATAKLRLFVDNNAENKRQIAIAKASGNLSDFKDLKGKFSVFTEFFILISVFISI